MRRRELLAAALALAVDPAAAMGAAAGGAAVALVTADLEAHVAALELGSGRVVRRIGTPSGPRSIESSPFGQVVVAHTGPGLVSILDAATLTLRSVLRGFAEPRYTAMHPGEAIAYVTDSKLGEVVTVDVEHAEVVRRTRIPGPARHLSVDSGTVLWTALGSRAERVAVLDLADPRRPRLARVITPPFLAHDVVVAPDGAHVWVTSGARNALAIYPVRGGAPRVLAAGAPPQHVAFARQRAFVASGVDGTVQLRRLDGSPLRTTRVPRGSYNVAFGSDAMTFGRPAVVTASLDRGTICVLSPGGAVRVIQRIARSAHDACIAETG
jgi:DNA-binding beta-propeller fold protein YncE